MARTVALVIGVLFLIGGVMGFVLVSGSGLLLGLLEVNPLHNVVHLVVGVFGVGTYFLGGVRRYLQSLGVFYLLLAAIGFIPGASESPLLVPLIHLNLGDNLLHLVVGLLAAFIGFAPPAGPTQESSPA